MGLQPLLPGMLSEIVSLFASQKTFLPDQYDCAAMMHATECANPSCTEACGCCRERMHSNQFAMCSNDKSSMPMGGSLVSPGSITNVDFRFASTSASSSCVPFSSTT